MVGRLGVNGREKRKRKEAVGVSVWLRRCFSLIFLLASMMLNQFLAGEGLSSVASLMLNQQGTYLHHYLQQQFRIQ